jgi:hypothetical protein
MPVDRFAAIAVAVTGYAPDVDCRARRPPSSKLLIPTGSSLIRLWEHPDPDASLNRPPFPDQLPLLAGSRVPGQVSRRG